jgi:hypothetical protein
LTTTMRTRPRASWSSNKLRSFNEA